MVDDILLWKVTEHWCQSSARDMLYEHAFLSTNAKNGVQMLPACVTYSCCRRAERR